MKLWRWLTTKQIDTHLIADESKIFFYGIETETRAEIKSYALEINFALEFLLSKNKILRKHGFDVAILLFCRLVHIEYR